MSELHVSTAAASSSSSARADALDGSLSPDAAAVVSDELAKSKSLQLLKQVLTRRRNSGEDGLGIDVPAEVAERAPSTSPEATAAAPAPSSASKVPVPPSPGRAVPLARVPSGVFSVGHAPADTASVPPTVPIAGPVHLQEVDVSSPHAFQRVVITGTNELTEEETEACKMLRRAMELRKHHYHPKPANYWGPFDQHSVAPFSPSPRPSHAGPMSPVNLSLPGSALQDDSHASRGSANSHAHTMPGVSSSNSLSSAIGTTSAATSAASPQAFRGSALVTAQTGKQYGNLFYRRRTEPKFTAFNLPILPPAGYRYRMVKGVVHVYAPVCEPDPARAGASRVDVDVDGIAEAEEITEQDLECGVFKVPSYAEFVADYKELLRIVHSPHVKSFSYRRLELLDAKFQLHRQLNATREIAEQKAVPHRDFYNVRKCDTHVHHSACMNQKHLLRFIKSKLKKEPDEVVIERDGKRLTLAEVFKSLNLTAYDLSVDTLDVHADMSTFHRFDRFNTKYNPVGQSRLREIFLKTDNLIAGRYLAELTREVFDDLEASKYQLVEYRLSIYGRSRDEWRKLAAWVVDNRLASPNVRWMIQIPRLYEAYFESGQIKSFQDMLNNIFLPLFEVTEDPSRDPKLHQFLSMVVGIDCVDDESKVETFRDASLPDPPHWTVAQQPPYQYWIYFLNANLTVLNKFRESRGLTQMSFRPHAGEAGDVDHLAATFLTAESINHGINLRKSPSLQYLYMLAQIGLAMSPLSNNRLFLAYDKNPFWDFFRKGLHVSLSTDDPLMLSFTREPLTEEYAVAAQVFKLSPADMCEIARISVLQSGFEAPFKAHWLGANYAEQGPAGNDINFSNVPYIRVQYRMECLQAELGLLEQALLPHPAVHTPHPTAAAIALPSASAAIAMASALATTAAEQASREGHVCRCNHH
jgi:AMP deaminase